MKGNELDELFRQKLRNQKLTPPPAAWAAVEQNMPGKKKKGAYFWVSMAASLLVIATIGWIALADNTNSPVLEDDNYQANNKEVKETPKVEQPQQSLMAETKDEPQEIIDKIEAPKEEVLVATKGSKPALSVFSPVYEPKEEVLISKLEPKRAIIAIRPLSINQHLTVEMSASQFKNDLVMPLNLSAFYIPYSEDLKLAPKKKKFRMINGIISIAKEVNSGKLSFSELRNAKNNFVVDDLKYGSKEVDSTADEGDDDKPNQPGKD